VFVKTSLSIIWILFFEKEQMMKAKAKNFLRKGCVGTRAQNISQ
jgi:hypothetical protein